MYLNTVEIGRRIRKLREDKKLSQESFAELIDTSTRTVSNIENGTVLPLVQTLSNIANACDCSVDYLLGFSFVYFETNNDEKEDVKK